MDTKLLLKIFLDNKNIGRKTLIATKTLDIIKAEINDLVPSDASYLKDGNIVDTEKEKMILLKDIVKDKSLFFITTFFISGVGVSGV